MLGAQISLAHGSQGVVLWGCASRSIDVCVELPCSYESVSCALLQRGPLSLEVWEINVRSTKQFLEVTVRRTAEL